MNSVIIGLFVGGLGALLGLNTEWTVMLSALAGIFLQKYLDVFFSLVVDKD